LVRVLQTLRIRWPDDVSLIAFDEPEWAEIVTPALAVMRHPTRAIARRAWDRLLGRMRRDDLPRTRRVLSAEFARGGSLGPPGS
jgi:LacI family transcriptional regulator